MLLSLKKVMNSSYKAKHLKKKEIDKKQKCVLTKVWYRNKIVFGHMRLHLFK